MLAGRTWEKKIVKLFKDHDRYRLMCSKAGGVAKKYFDRTRQATELREVLVRVFESPGRRLEVGRVSTKLNKVA